MRAARLEAVESLHVRDVPEPALRSGEVLLRVEACGVCGTDRHILHGEYSSALPVTLGHEFAGTIVAAGEGAGHAAGTRAAVDPNIACGVCRECQRGEVCLCPNRLALGVDLDGGLAELVAVPVQQVYPLPDGVPAEWGALCEPLACCLHALDLAHVRPGMRVVVLGGGVIGQLMVQLARLAGATTVVLVTRQAARRALAERLGATATYDPAAADPVAALRGPGGPVPGGADVVLECAGTVATFEQAIALARRGGTAVIFGVAPQGAVAQVSPFDVFARELRIVGAYLNPLTHGRAVEMVASGRLDLAPLVTRRISLEEAPAVIAGQPEPGEVKVLVML